MPLNRQAPITYVVDIFCLMALQTLLVFHFDALRLFSIKFVFIM